MNAFEYRPKVGLFLKKTISRLLQKWNHLKKSKKKLYKFKFTVNKNVQLLLYII